MEERAWWSGLLVLALGLAFALVSGLLWASGGRSYRLLRAKLRLGGLLLGLGAVAAGCGDKDDSNMVMCYDAGWDSDEYAQPDIEVDSTGLDFGAVVVGEGSLQVLTVSNNGGVDLNITGLALEDSAEVFELLDNSLGVLPPGVQREIGISFIPGQVLTYEGTLTITSDDPDHPELQVALLGEGVAT